MRRVSVEPATVSPARENADPPLGSEPWRGSLSDRVLKPLRLFSFHRVTGTLKRDRRCSVSLDRTTVSPAREKCRPPQHGQALTSTCKGADPFLNRGVSRSHVPTRAGLAGLHMASGSTDQPPLSGPIGMLV